MNDAERLQELKNHRLALEENTKALNRLGKQLADFNAVILAIGQRSGQTGQAQLLLQSFAQWLRRRA